MSSLATVQFCSLNPICPFWQRLLDPGAQFQLCLRHKLPLQQLCFSGRHLHNHIGTFHITLGPADRLAWLDSIALLDAFLKKFYQEEYSSFNPSVTLPKALLDTSDLCRGCVVVIPHVHVRFMQKSALTTWFIHNIKSFSHKSIQQLFGYSLTWESFVVQFDLMNHSFRLPRLSPLGNQTYLYSVDLSCFLENWALVHLSSSTL